MSRKRTTPLHDDAPHPRHCSSELRYEILGRAPYFKGLAAPELETVNSRFHEHHHPAEAVIFREGDPSSRLFFVAHGKVKLLRHSPSGDDVLLDILPQGALFGGLMPLGYRRNSETAIAQTDCCLLAITAVVFHELLKQHPAVTLEVLYSVAHRLDDARETIRQLTTSSVEIRVAKLLIKLAERLGEDIGDSTLIQSPLSHQDISSMVGATPETVSRIMARLKRTRMIETGRQWVRILDHERLQILAGT